MSFQSNTPEVGDETSTGSAPAAETPAAETTPSPAPSPAPPAAADAPSGDEPSSSEGAPSETPSASSDTSLGMVDEAAITWNGELDSLKSAEWFTAIDEKVRNPLLEGMQRKFKNLESGFTKKTQEIAEERRAFQTQEAKLKKELNYYQRFLDTGKSPSDQMVEEAEALRQQLEASKVDRATLETELRERLQAEIREKELTPLQQQMQQLAAEKAQADQVLESHRIATEKAAQERNNRVLDQLSLWVDTNAPGMWDEANAPALMMFENLLRHEVATDPETALRLVGAVHPSFDKSAAAPVPDSVEVMNTDSTVSFGQLGESTNLSYSDAKARMMAAVTKT